jgi:NACHT domain
LWLHSIPRCGKTILCSTIIESVKDFSRSKNSRYAYYYFDFNDAEKQNVKGLLRSLLTQLALLREDIGDDILKLYSENGLGMQEPGQTGLALTLFSVLQKLGRTYLLIDALDECSQRESLLQLISEIKNRCSSVSILVTSRNEYDIELSLKDIAICLGVQSTVVDEDIQIYVQSRLMADSKLRRWPQVVKEEIKQSLVEKAHGM